MKYYLFSEWRDIDSGGMESKVFDSESEVLEFLANDEDCQNGECEWVIIYGNRLMPEVKETKIVSEWSIK